MSRPSKPIPRICEQCGKDFLFWRWRSDLAKGRGRFCSNACQIQSTVVPLDQRFFALVGRKTESGCILWAGSFNHKGYGQIRITEKDMPNGAHRIAYQLMVGPIPDGLHVLHHCDNRACINPVHLFLGTNLDNMNDKISKGRQTRGEENGGAKLTAEKVREIRARYALGKESMVRIAKDYKIHYYTVHMVVRRKRWQHVA